MKSRKAAPGLFEIACRTLCDSYVACLTVFVLVALVGCGAVASETGTFTADTSGAAQPGNPPSSMRSSLPQAEPVGAGSPADYSSNIALASPISTPLPSSVSDASDEIVFVTAEEPQALTDWGGGCSRGVSNAVCADIASDPLTWIDSASFEVVSLTGVENWLQVAPNRWRFNLRRGVTFHNGETWNAEAAAAGLNYLGNEATSGHGAYSFGFHGVISGRVVDEMTVDVVCQVACPIFPRTAIYTSFQAPEWWEDASQEVRDLTTVGLGPYRIAGYVPGVEVSLEAHEGYVPNEASDARAPAVSTARQVWHPDASSRAAMVQSGEAHWAADIGLEDTWFVPVALTGTTNQVFTLVADNIWHPELKKKSVREALALAIDCDLLMDILYDGLHKCIGNVSQWGTAGISESNFAPYGYDPERARELLAVSDYDPANVIRIHTRLDHVYRSLALLESVATMWEDVGVNAEVVVLDPASASDYRRSGCGQIVGQENQLRCAQMSPPSPVEASTHYYETVTSNETLDMQRQLLLRTSCHGANSRVCNLVPGVDGMTFQESIADAAGTPMGRERTRKMEELTQIIHDEHWFLPFFVTAQVYGLAENLDWEPRYDTRLRLNTMAWSQ